ncbi:neuronal acetylcholine receptor subunit alpha-3-like, partial [Saccoglossus kowalevskii]|uniref:Neuronal acetylcholine receptor subunit alpha-4-like n=1 Tax=Saccoglossus kowalevskii TaxID=10224 RepID=A0ABM0LZE9_SACKO
MSLTCVSNSNFSADTYVLPVARHSRLFSNGTVISSAPASLTAPCIIYIQYFPFDIQQCEYRFTTWETNAEEVAMYPLTSTILKVDFLENTEWNIVNTSVTSKLVFYPCCEAPYSTITCLLTIQRRPLYYLITVAMPCHILSILTALTFMLPPCSGEKLTVGISILLNLAVLNLVIANIMPATSIDIPLIVKYIIFSMVFVSTSIVASIFVLSVYHNKSEHRPGRRMRKIFLDILPRLFFLKPFHDDPSLNVFDDKYTLRITDSNMDISKKDFNFENGDYDFERQGLSEYAVKVTESESSREVKRIRGRRSDKPLKYIVRSARQKHEAAAANGSESTSTVRCEHCSLTAEEALLLEILGKENCILDNVGRLAKKERDVIIERQ